VRRSARLVILAALLIAVTLTVVACAPGDPADSPGYVSGDGAVTEWSGDDRPGPLEVSGTAFDGSVVDLSDLRGEVVVLTTWYAACPPCRAEAPDLVELDALEGVSVVGINGEDDAGTAQAFERTFGVTYPSIEDHDGQAIAALQGLVAINAVPTALILDADGRVAARTVGRVEPSTLAALVAAAGVSAAATDGS
jgi:peroxiredoxin